MTVRTFYDRRSLRGKGFIYMTPDMGTAKRPKGIPENLWSSLDSRVLYSALVHELGHVFGLPDSGVGNSLMNYDYMERLVANPVGLLLDYATVKVTTHPIYQSYCEDRTTPFGRYRWQERVLGIPAGLDQICVEISYGDDRLRVKAGPADSEQVVGEAKVTVSSEQNRSLVSVWLPPEQVIYHYRNADAPHRYDAVSTQRLRLTGTYRVLATGATTPIFTG